MIDIAALREFMDDDVELLDATVESYNATFAEVFQKIVDAYQAQDSKAAEEGLHALKGMVANFFAKEFVDALQAWENAAREASLGFSETDLQSIRDWHGQLQKDLEQLLNEMQQAS